MTLPLLRPTNDFVFKKLLVCENEVLKYVLTAVLKPASPIVSADVLNPEISPDFADEKATVLDVNVRLQDGTLVDIEMQCRPQNALDKRFLYYWARSYASQLKKGESYANLAPCKGIFFLDFHLNGSTRFHNTFKLKEDMTGLEFGSALELHTVELPKLQSNHLPNEALEHWTRFLLYNNPQEIEELSMRDPIIQRAKHRLELLSSDPATRQLARDRETGRMFYRLDMGEARHIGRQEGLEEGRQEGREEGRQEAARAILVQLLKAKFGTLSQETEDRIQQASADMLFDWIARTATASQLDEVFTSKP